MLQSKGKPKLSEEILQDNNIFFHPKLHKSEDLEGWIRSIREQLVRLRKQLPSIASSRFANELKDFRCLGQDRKEAIRDKWSLNPDETEPVYVVENEFGPGPAWEKLNEEMRVCTEVVGEAKMLRIRNEQESAWMKFLQDYFFIPFRKTHNNLNSYE